jgi:predicted dithiol-disulfide oxidoreductase (DUF899 family)
MQHNPVVSRDEWLTARKQLLTREKEYTRLRDTLSAERRGLPWVRVEKPYVFDGPQGKETLADLFGGHSQLIVKHFMFGPGWAEGCVGCSFHADHMEGALLHLGQRDVTLLCVSRAPLPEIEAFKRRMGWRFKWVSSFESDFNYDFNVSATEDDIAKGKMYYNYEERDLPCDEMSGISVFYKDAAGDIFHTYSSFARGNEDWVRHHDRYGAGGHVARSGRYVATDTEASCCAPERAAE